MKKNHLLKTRRFTLDDSKEVCLTDYPTRTGGGLKKEEAIEAFRRLRRRLVELQELMYAQNRHSLLVVFQAMDTAGKDSTIRSVFGPVNPQGCRVTSFKVPSSLERSHDFLWRIHPHVPGQGLISVFNRSHYEDVLVVRVKELLPRERWKPRYEQINAFEQMLASEGTTIVKFFLHISKDHQKSRLERRRDRPDKQWKLSPSDLTERGYWDDYQQAYEKVLSRCATHHAPWVIVPAERRWFRNLLVTQVLVEKLEALNMTYPKPTFDVSGLVID